jgi:hypothetical protein
LDRSWDKLITARILLINIIPVLQEKFGDIRKREPTKVPLKPLTKMYYYLSFLRPPPTTVDLASPFASNGITITPQIANDLRTESVTVVPYLVTRHTNQEKKLISQ